VRKVIAGGLEPPVYGPRPRRVTQLQPFEPYLRERLAAVPELTGRRLHREIAALGYRGGYYISPEVETPFSMFHIGRGRPFMVQRNGFAMVWLK
jgi:transposase